MARMPSPSNLYALVDMGSNGIRYSITDLTPGGARSLPTIYQDRLGVSLYDAQFPTPTSPPCPIPQATIDEVLSSLLKFKTACVEFGVPPANVRVLATEATRNAVNSIDYRRQITEAVGWEVDMLPKEAEGRIGAMGVASSFDEVEGLVMDLGGGSTQITWMVAQAGNVQTSPVGSISFPYGAAALTRTLAAFDENPHATDRRHELTAKMTAQFRQAFEDLQLPDSLKYKAAHGGLTLYLSGGGFRGWGYLLMSSHKISPYPIPIINGFHVAKREFKNTAAVTVTAAEESVFRISKRRAAQVPAVAFLVNVLVDAIPCIQQVRFCQGGVREGFLYDALTPAVRAVHPLESATGPFGATGAPAIAALLWDALPGDNDLGRTTPPTFTASFARCVADMMYVHGTLPKESRSLAALFAPLTGVLASAHGIAHGDRALLALVLCERWKGDLPPPYESLQTRLRNLLTVQEVWWANYLGNVAGLVGQVYPAGVVEAGHERLKFSARWADGMGKRGLEQGVKLKIRALESSPMTTPIAVNDAIEEIEKVGKPKNRIGGKEHGFGVRVEVGIDRLDAL